MFGLYFLFLNMLVYIIYSLICFHLHYGLEQNSLGTYKFFITRTQGILWRFKMTMTVNCIWSFYYLTF